MRVGSFKASIENLVAVTGTTASVSPLKGKKKSLAQDKEQVVKPAKMKYKTLER